MYPLEMLARASVTDLAHAILFTQRLITLSETHGGSPRLRLHHLEVRAALVEALSERVIEEPDRWAWQSDGQLMDLQADTVKIALYTSDAEDNFPGALEGPSYTHEEIEDLGEDQ